MKRDKMSNKSTRLFRDTLRHYASCHSGDIHIFSQHIRIRDRRVTVQRIQKESRECRVQRVRG